MRCIFQLHCLPGANFAISDEDDSYFQDLIAHRPQGTTRIGPHLEIGLDTLTRLVDSGKFEDVMRHLERYGPTMLREAYDQQEEEQREAMLIAASRRDLFPKSSKKARAGYIYLVEADNGLFKIGRTRTLDKRIHTFGVKIPMRTKLLHSFRSSNYSAAEKILHERYKDFRDHGEWFRLTESHVAEICAVKDNEI